MREHKVGRWGVATLLSLSLGVLGLTALPAAAATATPQPADDGSVGIYVSPNGNDAGNATRQHPIRTLQRAQQLVRQLRATSSGPINVYLGGGTYRLSDPLNFTAEDSGEQAQPVTWQAAPGQHPVISGARPVTGWTLFDSSKNVYRAPVGSLHTAQLYVNGALAPRAQSATPPPLTQTADGFTTQDANMLQWPDIANMEVLGHAAFRSHVCKVDHVSGNELIMAQPCWTNTNLELGFGRVTGIENTYELLHPGQWYIDSGYLYYMAQPGQTPADAKIDAPQVQSLLTGIGSPANPVGNLTFRGITFTGATWTTPDTNDGYAPTQSGVRYTGTVPPQDIGWNGVKTPAAVTFNYDTGVTFDGDTFTNLGAYALDLGTGTKDATVQGSRFENIEAGGIELGGTRAIDHHPSDPAAITEGNTISNNVFVKTGLRYLDTDAIFAGYVAHTTISHNTISDLPYTGISLGWGWGSTDPGGNPTYPDNGGQPVYQTPTTNHDDTISSNRIDNVMNANSDGGGIYSLGASPGTKIADNYISNLGSSNGLYPDEGSAYETFTGNIVQHAPAWLSIHTPSIHDLSITHNYTDSPNFRNDGTNIEMSDNTTVTGSWPGAACQIAAQSGVGPRYQYLLDGLDLPTLC